MTSLSVVIPATDRAPTLERTMAAIRGAESPPEEVIVVDGPPGLGPAAARNLGARKAAGEVLVFVDADVEIHGDVFTRIREAFAGDPDLAATFGSYDDDPGGPGIVSDFRNLLHHHVHQEGAGEASTFWAGLGAIRRDVFFEFGGFDEERFPRPAIEDIELGMRLHTDGRRIVLDPTIQGKHLKKWTLLSMTKTDLHRRSVPWLRLMLERGSGSTALNLGWRHRLSTAASLLFAAALVRRKFRLARAALALALVADIKFYKLLARRRGPALVAASLPLHILHRLTSVAALPLAVIAHLRAMRR